MLIKTPSFKYLIATKLLKFEENHKLSAISDHFSPENMHDMEVNLTFLKKGTLKHHFGVDT